MTKQELLNARDKVIDLFMFNQIALALAGALVMKMPEASLGVMSITALYNLYKVIKIIRYISNL